MYLPQAELQQWCGQIYCPYCIQEIRDEEKRAKDAGMESSRRIGGAEIGKPTASTESGFAIAQQRDETKSQCWRCRMYFPKYESQQWRGYTYCQRCILDIQNEERNAEDRMQDKARKAGEAIHRPLRGDKFPPSGTAQLAEEYACESCGKDLEMVYILANHKYCDACFTQQVRAWKEQGIELPQYIKFKLKERKGLFARFFDFLLKFIKKTK